MTRPALRLEQFFTIAASVLRTATTASNEAWRLAAANAPGLMWVFVFALGPFAMLTGQDVLLEHFTVTIGTTQIPGGYTLTAVAALAKSGTIVAKRARGTHNVPIQPCPAAWSGTSPTIGEQHDER